MKYDGLISCISVIGGG